jgi:hypothetical protein
MAGKVEFNFTPEQQEKFNLIYAETEKLHPELLKDKVGKHRVKVLIAYTIINGDEALKIFKEDDNDYENVFEEITKEEINETI